MLNSIFGGTQCVLRWVLVSAFTISRSHFIFSGNRKNGVELRVVVKRNGEEILPNQNNLTVGFVFILYRQDLSRL